MVSIKSFLSVMAAMVVMVSQVNAIPLSAKDDPNFSSYKYMECSHNCQIDGLASYNQASMIQSFVTCAERCSFQQANSTMIFCSYFCFFNMLNSLPPGTSQAVARTAGLCVLNC
ncbi:MAG: hypothetical protein J3Q66DRAFT_346955 [Benniella sp.]|nr:MAG: hypothetical protein J3Q66DRAFT_346955 [Benniella sp.]